MNWNAMIWSTEQPEKSGKYIVETISMMGNKKKLESTYDKKTNKWRFSNQIFNRYIKEF